MQFYITNGNNRVDASSGVMYAFLLTLGRLVMHYSTFFAL
jgi:hypothetical protein